jgi:SAM-dependent methyltransferase
LQIRHRRFDSDRSLFLFSVLLDGRLAASTHWAPAIVRPSLLQDVFAADTWHHDLNSALIDSGREFLLTARQRSRRYPARLLRYFIPFHWIGREAARRGRALRVCEIGIAHGLMLNYMLHGLEHLHVDPAQVIARWIGVDVHLLHDHLGKLPYDQLIEADLEADIEKIDLDCDVCILLHVLEHLLEPEKAIAEITARLPPGALLIAGFPAHPHVVIQHRERRLRARTNENGHVSALSLRRFNAAARANGCTIEVMQGGYFLRSSGSFLEDRRWWQRFNLAWGRLVPGWLTEAYIAARRR